MVGKREFFSLDFKVTPATLIPRPETEGIVVRLLDICRQRGDAAANPRVIDVGTGSGAVAITLAKHLPTARVVATDCSEEALAVAAVNVEHHGVGDRVQLVACDPISNSTSSIQMIALSTVSWIIVAMRSVKDVKSVMMAMRITSIRARVTAV